MHAALRRLEHMKKFTFAFETLSNESEQHFAAKVAECWDFVGMYR